MGQQRWVIYLVVVSLSFVIPAALCTAVAMVGVSSVAGLITGCLAAAAWMSLLALVNWWEFTSRWLRWVWLAALVMGMALRAHEARALPLISPTGLGFAVAAVLAAVALWLLAAALAARRCGGDGARSFLMNYHYGFGQHRASGVNRSMRYAMDVVEVGCAGGESDGLLPRRNDAYRIWERPHLHMQAMRSADGDWWHGEPLALRFGGRFVVRNQLVRS